MEVQTPESPSIGWSVADLTMRITYTVPANLDFDYTCLEISNYVTNHVSHWGQVPNNEELRRFISEHYGNDGPMRTYSSDITINIDDLISSDDDIMDNDLLYALEETQYRPPSPRKLSKREISRLNTQLDCVKSVKKAKEDISCVICTESVVSGRKKKVKLKQCDHTFHFNCLKQWVSCNPSCPICRAPITID
jgi:hypothetical protein